MLAPWKKSYDKPRQCSKKQRDHFADRGSYSQSYCFSSSHVWIWVKSESRSVVSNPLWPHRLYSPRNYLGQNIGVGSLFFLQGIFQTQGSNPGLPHCRWILYQLSHKGSPRILERVAYSFSSKSSQPRNQTGVSCIAGRFFTNWAIREWKIPKTGKQFWHIFLI